jgi:hypothetical protein
VEPTVSFNSTHHNNRHLTYKAQSPILSLQDRFVECCRHQSVAQKYSERIP